MNVNDKPLVWLHGEVKSPPFSRPARLEAGFLLRKLQRGDMLSMPHARPMPSIGPQCHELRVHDELVVDLDDGRAVTVPAWPGTAGEWHASDPLRALVAALALRRRVRMTP